MKTKRRLRYAGAGAVLLGCAAAVPALAWWHRTASGPAVTARARATVPQAGGDPQTSAVLQLRQQGGAARMQQIAELYGAWAANTNALAARQLALGTLFDQPSLGQKLQGVLDAIVADPTPPSKDPLWPLVVDQLAGLWTAETFDRGRDLMLMETRPRAQRALVASFIRMSQSERGAELGEQQRLALASDFVDVYSNADGEQKAELDRALRLLAGDDVVDILRGRTADLQLTADMMRDEAIREAMEGPPAPAEGAKHEASSEQL